jgi:hypothetical protein
LVISHFFRKFFNREYNFDLIWAVEDSGEGQMPTQPTAEQADDGENHRIKETLEKVEISSTSDLIEESSVDETESIKKIQSAFKDSSEEKKDNFWDSI